MSVNLVELLADVFTKDPGAFENKLIWEAVHGQQPEHTIGRYAQEFLIREGMKLKSVWGIGQTFSVIVASLDDDEITELGDLIKKSFTE